MAVESHVDTVSVTQASLVEIYLPRKHRRYDEAWLLRKAAAWLKAHPCTLQGINLEEDEFGWPKLVMTVSDHMDEE